ncbi:MAG: hypothetical protein IJB79_00870 [Candidatus Gastranaerophilales bacterium]|nr:hypothetical protein [Candidatus Gastranaerophilales bacterium]
MIKKIKFEILYCTIFALILYSIFIPLACYCSEETKVIIITKEDIKNAKPRSPYQVNFSNKDLKAIEIMERRHFPRTYPEFSDKERLKNLEYELLGRIWEFTPQEERIKKLKLASSNTALIGTALPASISSKRNAKKLRNNEIQLRQRDNVGLIDGFLRLMSPEKYEIYRKSADKLYYKYEY